MAQYQEKIQQAVDCAILAVVDDYTSNATREARRDMLQAVMLAKLAHELSKMNEALDALALIASESAVRK